VNERDGVDGDGPVSVTCFVVSRLATAKDE
jgi:hypothetical protein